MQSLWCDRVYYLFVCVSVREAVVCSSSATFCIPSWLLLEPSCVFDIIKPVISMYVSLRHVGIIRILFIHNDRLYEALV